MIACATYQRGIKDLRNELEMDKSLMHTKTPHSIIGALVILLLCWTPLMGHQESEEQMIRKTLEDYYASFIKKDIKSVKARWSSRSPDFEDLMKSFLRVFQDTGPIELESLAINKIEIDGKTAQAEASVVMTGTHLPTREPAGYLGKLDRIITLVKEQGVWKLFRYEDANESFLAQFVNAEAKKERDSLIEGRARHITSWMVPSILTAALDKAEDGQYELALVLIDRAFELAEYLQNDSQIGWSHSTRGLIYFYQSQYIHAMEEYLLALPYLRKAKDRLAEARTMFNIASVFKEMQKVAESPRAAQRIEILTACLHIAEEADDKEMEMSALNSMVDVYMELKNYAEALRISRAFFIVARQASDNEKQVAALSRIGDAHEAMHRYEDALRAYEELEVMVNKMGWSDAARIAHQSVERLRKLLGR